MTWRRTGLVIDPGTLRPTWWNRSHVQLAAPVFLDDKLRIYFSTRDEHPRSRTTFVELDPDTLDVTYTHPDFVLDIGPPGACDDCGAMGSSIVLYGHAIYMFYVAWNVPTTVSWRNTTGLAISHDGGYSFEKVPGPVLGRSPYNPFMASGPWVIPFKDRWRMWHYSGLGWEDHDGKLEPSYNLRVADSTDLLDWRPIPGACIPLGDDAAISVPCVLNWEGKWRMWYSHRGNRGYRTDPKTAYHIGYAESPDGESWVRMDDSPWALSKEGGDWERVMQCYPRVYEYGGTLHMLYNGDGFGETGIGHAVWSPPATGQEEE